MKKAHKLEFKETAIPTQPKTAGLKPESENVARRKLPSKSLKCPSTRYGQQIELKEQNQLLMATNEDLQKHIAEMKENMATLEQQCTDLQGEKGEIQKRLRDCHVLLVAENIDPVLGERIGETTHQKEEQRNEVMNVSKDLLNELKLFGEMATEHRTQLAEMQNTMKDLKEAREKLLPERDAFSLEVEEMEQALEDAEGLLLE